MIELHEADFIHIDQEYALITSLPINENGFTNPYFGITKDEFIQTVLPRLIYNSKGIGLLSGYVKETTYFIYLDDMIIGMLRIRHQLNDALRNGAGHIGYSIQKEYRKKGYASEALRLAIEKAKDIIEEDEIYMSVHKDNQASLRVQIKNGAYIHHEDEKEYYTRIKIGRNEL